MKMLKADKIKAGTQLVRGDVEVTKPVNPPETIPTQPFNGPVRIGRWDTVSSKPGENIWSGPAPTRKANQIPNGGGSKEVAIKETKTARPKKTV